MRQKEFVPKLVDEHFVRHRVKCFSYVKEKGITLVAIFRTSRILGPRSVVAIK
jgi:hypothetical protein